MNEQHDLVQSVYDPAINACLRSRRKAAGKLGICLLIILIGFLVGWFVLSPVSIGSPLAWAIDIAVMIAPIIYGGALLKEVYESYLWEKRARRQKNIYLSYPPHVIPSVKEAYETTSKNIMNFDPLKNSHLDKQAKQYVEFEKLSLEELRKRLTGSGVLAPDGAQKRGATSFDEGLMLTVYVRRLDREKVTEDATRTAQREASREAGTRPDLKTRKETEQKKASIDAELENLLGERTQRSEPLSAFNGVCVLHFVKNQIEKAVFSLPAGEYSIELYDFQQENGQTKRISIVKDSAPYEMELAGKVQSPQQTELTVRKSGIPEEYRFTLEE